jgi:tRNA G46 methylase TrmB
MLKIRQQLTTLITMLQMVTLPRNREKIWAGRTLIDAHGFMHSEDEQATLQLLDILQNIKFQKVLEVGGNCGARLFLLARNNPQINVICTDINQSALQVGRDYAHHKQIHNLHFNYLNVSSKKSLKTI